MGIPSYFSHIVKKHRNILKQYDSHRMAIHNLYMDCNSLIYDAVRELDDEANTSLEMFESALIQRVCEKIVVYIKKISPKNRVFIAFDGVAPVAKLDQQRNRRYKSGFESRILRKLNNKPYTETWNTVAITPGTKFMETLGNAVINRFSNVEEFGLQHLVVSASQEPGEGEHKIYSYIRNNTAYHRRSTTVIYGLDADLIMLTLNHLHIAPRMFLFRETPHFIKSVDNSLSPNSDYFLDIPLFGKLLAKELNNNKTPNTVQQHNRVFDYIFLCFILGNDFMPHFPALNIRTTGIERLLSAYRKVIGSKNENLIYGGKIVWKNLRKLIIGLAENEEQMMRDEYLKRDKQSRNTKQRRLKPVDAFLSIPLLERREEIYINPYERGWEKRYYATLLDTEINDERRKEICINYLEGLEWTFKYYTEGCVDWRWTYKYDYPPLLSDLCKYIPYFDTTFLNNCQTYPVSEYVQLSYVLPGHALKLLPSPLETALRREYSGCYCDDYEFCWAFCKYFWEAHARMPHINIVQLEHFVKSHIS